VHRVVLALLVLAAVVLLPSPARADVSSGASVNAGASFIDQGQGDENGAPVAGATGMASQGALSLQAGLGTTPANFLIGGGLFHLETHFGRGTDIGLLARLATQSFVLGRWGGALDLGGYERFWGIGSAGGVGALVLGAPWGLQLRGEAAFGTHDARSFGILLGIDFARLTVFRTTGDGWYPNPYPGYREPAK
jgi:hypothetical protein